jgi:hypothetical protein
MILPVKSGYQLLTRWRPLLIHPSVRNIIAGRSRSETPQAVPDGSLTVLFFYWIVFIKFLDWGTLKPLDKEPVSTPIKRGEKRVGAPDEVKGKEIEILWPTEGEIQAGEYTKPQWERKQVNVRENSFFKIIK